MQITPSGERPFPTPPAPNTPNLESARFANRDTVVLPDEMVIRILEYLGTSDIAVCRSVSRQWQTVIDARHLLARSFYRDCHLAQRINSLAVERNLAVERYHSHIRGWLTDFSARGRKTSKQLDNILENKHFPEVLFFSIPKLLLTSNGLTYQNTATIGLSGRVRDASFSSDGKYLVIKAYNDSTAKLSELEGGQWQKKVTLRHSAWVESASFSPDGKLLVTTSSDHICKIWRLEDDQWQENATIRHSVAVRKARFSPDGKHLVIVSARGCAKIWWHVDGRWAEKVTIEHNTEWTLTNVRFSPDGKHLGIASDQGTVKIWKLDDGQWEEKFTIQHSFCVEDVRFSPDGKHLVTVTSVESLITTRFHRTTIWELVDVQSQENETIQQWQEKVTHVHYGIVLDVHFSPDGKHFVAATRGGTARICGLEGGNWRVKATIWHSGPVAKASFSRDGKFLVTASSDCTAKICGLVGGKWQVKATIGHTQAVTNASFGPDYQLATVSGNNTNTARIWVLKNKENDDNSELVTSLKKNT